MNKSFTGENVSFFLRLSKKLVPLILILIFGFFRINFGRAFSGDFENYKIHFSILLIICFVIGVYYNVDKTRTVVNKIIFSENDIQIIGQDFTTKYNDILNINKTKIEIQEEQLGKNKTRLCLEIYSEDKYYYLNKINNWQYSTLAQIVDEYNLKTGKEVKQIELYQQLKETRKKG